MCRVNAGSARVVRPTVFGLRVEPVSFAAGGRSERRYAFMSRTFHHGERRIRVRGIKRDPADLRRLARALIEMAQAQAEAEAAAAHEDETRIKKEGSPRRARAARSEDSRREEAA